MPRSWSTKRSAISKSKSSSSETSSKKKGTPCHVGSFLLLTLYSVDEDEIDDRCEALRRKLEQERKDGKDVGPNAKRLKAHQVHDLAKAKAEESERLRKALGISADYEEGSHWRKQEERMRDSLAKREAEDEVKTERAKEGRRYKEEDSE